MRILSDIVCLHVFPQVSVANADLMPVLLPERQNLFLFFINLITIHNRGFVGLDHVNI